MTTTNGRPEGGWLKLFYRFKEWEWYADTNMVRLFIHLLLNANYRPLKWRGETIPRGSLVTSLEKLHQQTGLSVQEIRTCLKRLISTNEITSRSTNKERIITLCKYELYQADATAAETAVNKQANNQPTGSQQSNNNQLTTSKEYKNIIREESKEYEVVVDGATREFFLESFFSDIAAAVRLAGNLGTDEATMRRLAAEVLDEWELTMEPPHASIREARRHLLAQLRIKVQEIARSSTKTKNKPQKSAGAAGDVNSKWEGFPTLPAY